MAKRRRLTPPAADMPALETKAMFPMGLAPRAAPPIAVQAAHASGAAALEEMAEVLHRARADGRMILSLDLATIDADHLVRDRISLDTEEMETLRASIAARGQQVPIEVTALPDGRYGLISGLRRLTALRALHAADPDAGFGTVLALLRRPEDVADAYLAMVEENEIRAGISYYERARIVVKSVEQKAFPDTATALRHLYAAASRPKRSKIGSFVHIVAALDGALSQPEQIGERLGLKLAKGLEADAGLAGRLRNAVAADPAAEAAILEAALKPAKKGSKRLTETETGVTLHRRGTRVTLQGPGVTDDFCTALETFLADLPADVSRAKR